MAYYVCVFACPGLVLTQSKQLFSYRMSPCCFVAVVLNFSCLLLIFSFSSVLTTLFAFSFLTLVLTSFIPRSFWKRRLRCLVHGLMSLSLYLIFYIHILLILPQVVLSILNISLSSWRLVHFSAFVFLWKNSSKMVVVVVVVVAVDVFICFTRIAQ